VEFTPNWRAVGLFLYYFPDSSNLDSPPTLDAPTVLLRTLFLEFIEPGSDRVNFNGSILAIDNTGALVPEAIGGFFIIEALGNEFPGIGIPSLSLTTDPFRVTACSDCTSTYSVKFTTCSEETICSLSGDPVNPNFQCSSGSDCGESFSEDGSIIGGQAVTAQEGQVAALFADAGVTISVIIHNDVVTVLLKADDPDSPVQVQERIIGSCSPRSICVPYAESSEAAADGSFTSTRTDYVVVEPTVVG